MEEWRDISGYEGKYQVSNTGKVRSLRYNNTNEIRELKQKMNKKTGQYQVYLSKNNKRKDYMVGRLVAEHFIPNPMCKPVAMHISKDKSNNSVENLAWAYISEERHNTYNKGSRKIGKPTFTLISYNNKNYNNYVDIAKDVGMSKSVFKKRLLRGWGLYEALEIPTGRGVKNV